MCSDNLGFLFDKIINYNKMEENQQELMFKLSMFEQQVQQLQQQIQAVEGGIQELDSLNEGLESLRGKKDEEIFAPIGRGIFAKAKLISEDLLMDVGGKNLVKKDISQTQEVIKDQINKLGEIKIDLDRNMKNLSGEMEKILGEAQAKSEGKE